MSDEKPVQLKRKVSGSSFSSDNDMVCVVHYDRCRDVEIRPLSDSQIDSIREAAAVRQAQVPEGHRLDFICHNVPPAFDKNIHGAHRWCFKNFTNVSRLRSRSVTPVPPTTAAQSRVSGRSSCTSRPSAAIFPQDKCIFCGINRKYKKGSRTLEVLAKCLTETAETVIKEAARSKDDFRLLGEIDGVDLIAKEARYHESCRKDYVRKAERTHHSDDEASTGQMSEQLAAYNDAFQWLCGHIKQDILMSGKVERMTMLRDRFLQYVENVHPDFYNPLYTSQKLKSRIVAEFGSQLVFWLPQQRCKSELVFSADLDIGEAVEAAFSLSSSDEYLLDKAASVLQKHVKDSFSSSSSQPWPPTVSSLKSVHPPALLYNFLIRLITGKPASAADVTEKDARTANSVSQDLCSAVTRSRWVMPKHVLLGMSLRHLTGSAEVVSIVSRYGHCQSYSKLLELETALAYQAEYSDTVLPPGISTTHNLVTNVCFDNFDLLEETLSGADTTHSTHGIVVQELTADAELVHDVDTDLEKSRQRTFQYTHESLREVRMPTKAEPDITPSSLTGHDRTDQIAVEQGCMAWSVCHGLCNFTKSVPEWSGWISVTAKPTHLQPSNIRYLKPIMHPITQLSTVQHCLQTAMEITRRLSQEHTFVTFDLAAAKLALSLVWNNRDMYRHVTVHLGAFHTMCSYMAAVGRMMTGSGFEEVIIQSGVCASGSLDQVIRGKHFNRAMRVHGHMLAAVERLLLQVFVDRYGVDITAFPELLSLADEPSALRMTEVTDSCTVSMLFRQFSNFLDAVRQGTLGKTAQFWVQYRDCIWSLLLFVKAVKVNDVELYIYSLRQLCPLLFAADRQNYARYLPLYHSMLTEVSPEVYAQLDSNGMSVSRSFVPGCRIPIDMAIEQTINRSAKTMGGIVGFSRNIHAYYRWCLTRHKKGEFLEVVRDELGFNTTSQSFVHTTSRPSSCKRTEHDIQQIVDAFTSLINPFSMETSSHDALYCVSSGRPADAEIEEDLQSYTCKGEQAAVEFIKTRLIEKTVSFHAPMKKLKLKTFADMAVVKKIPTAKQKSITVKAERNLLGQLLILSQSNDISFDKLFQFSLSPVPWSLGTGDGCLVKTDKSQLMHVIEDEFTHDAIVIVPEKCAFVVDGNALIRSMTLLPDTFGEFAAVVLRSLPKCSTVHFVTDSYYAHSIKTLERVRRGTCPVHVIGGPASKLPRDFGRFMLNADNKRQLLKFLLREWQQPQFAAALHGRLLYFVDERQCTCLSSDDGVAVEVSDIPDLHSSQEEADSRIILHCMYIAHSAEPHESIVVRSPDTDVFVLLLHFSESIGKQLFFDTGTGNKRRVLDVSSIATGIGPVVCKALPSFHSFTGCDTTSAFVRKGKRGPFAKMRNNQQYLQVFGEIGESALSLTHNSLQCLEQFVCDMYGFRKLCDVDKLRSVLFQSRFGAKLPRIMSTESASGVDLSMLPPCRAALMKHCLRATYQTFIWKHAHTRDCQLPPPNGFGWLMKDDQTEIDWIDDCDVMPRQLADVLEESLASSASEVDLDEEELTEEDDVMDNIVDVVFDDEEDD